MRMSNRIGASRIDEKTSYRLQLGLLLLVSAVVHFAQFLNFGLYEDDFWSIAPAMSWDWSRTWAAVVNAWEDWPVGRPLNHALPPLLAWLGNSMGGLHAIYILGALWWILNLYLLYRVLVCRFSPELALIGVAAYAFFPADMTRPFLTHVAHVQGAMTFTFLALLLFDSVWWRIVLGNMVGWLTLLTYESAFLPFAVLPWLELMLKRRPRWGLAALHASLVLTSMLSVILIRRNLGDARMTEGMPDSILEFLIQVSMAPVLGFATMLKLNYVSIWPQVISHMNYQIALTIVGSGGALAWMLYRAVKQQYSQELEVKRHAVKYITIGLITAATSYCFFAFGGKYPPTYDWGRGTGAHMAAAFGMAVVTAAGLEWIRHCGRKGLLLAVVCVGGIWFGIAGGFHMMLQDRYVQTWAEIKYFWQELWKAGPFDRSTTVFIEGKRRQQTELIMSRNTPLDNNIFEYLADYKGEGWGPKLFWVSDLKSVELDGNEVLFRPYPWSDVMERVEWRDLLVLRMTDPPVAFEEVMSFEHEGHIYNRTDVYQSPGSEAEISSFGSELLK